MASLGAFSLLLWMIREGNAAPISALLHLVPPTTAVTARVLLDEPLRLVAIAGIGLTAHPYPNEARGAGRHALGVAPGTGPGREEG